MTAVGQLYAKLRDEYNSFLDILKTKTPDEIINSAYEKVAKEEILINVGVDGLHGAQGIEALLALKEPLDEIYRYWLKSDMTSMGDLENVIQEFADKKHDEYLSSVTTNALNGTLKKGDWVIAAPFNEYSFLIGTVSEIDKLGTPEHTTENMGDDVHVDFTAFGYSSERIAAIEEAFKENYYTKKAFEDLPLDDVIMAPEMLIRITELGLDEIDRIGNQVDSLEKFALQFPNESKHLSGLQEAFNERIDKNLSEYINSLAGLDNREMYERAKKISEVQEAYEYMRNHHAFSPVELAFYLEYQNPLSIIADAWHDRNEETFSCTMDDMDLTNEALTSNTNHYAGKYPKMSDLDTSKHPQKGKPTTNVERPETGADTPQKPSISDRLAEGKEKAAAYKEQKAKTHVSAEKDEIGKS